jgi:hypothetical protein
MEQQKTDGQPVKTFGLQVTISSFILIVLFSQVA